MYRVESNMGGYLMRSLASAVSPIRLVRSPLIFNTSSIYRSKASHRIRVSFDTPSALSICCWLAVIEAWRRSDSCMRLKREEDELAEMLSQRLLAAASSPDEAVI